ncbi:MAG: MlaD family protein [Solirubrobacteraceae bacterium]
MRRLIVIALVLAAGGAAAMASARSGDEPAGNQFTVELDNAFGVVEGADVKIAGVRAGRVTGMRVDRRSKRALIDFEITKQGFGSLRADAFCETRPQSLIGEYFVDCQPGTDERRLKAGSTIPVERTASTVPVDLINNIMRRPYRERLRIILSELGAGVGGRAEGINEAIRRAVPALRETDRVLAILARQNQVLADLTRDADTVIGDLAGNRRDVGRWVKETQETAAASAERSRDIRASLQRLPTFLRELKPTMEALGEASDAQAPMLADLNASAGQLEDLFKNLQEFSPATEVSLRSLAEASETGRPALRAAQPTIDLLNSFSEDTPELSNNLAIVLKHLDDRNFAVEKDPRSPGGQGYTGFEALLQYIFDQTLGINIFDANGYILKINLFHSKCSEFQNRDSLKHEMEEDPSFYADCAAILGPNQPGITTPDPTATGKPLDEGHHPPKPPTEEHSRENKRAEPEQRPPAADSIPERVKEEVRKLRRAKKKKDPRKQLRDAAREMQERLEETLGIDIPDIGAPPQLPSTGENLPQPPAAPQVPNTSAEPLLDFLLAP